MKFKILLLLCTALIITSGCVTILQDFEQDSLEQVTDQNSVLYWNVNIRDAAIRAEDLVARFYISWYDPANNKFVSTSSLLRSPWIKWTSEDGVTTVKGPIFKNARSGRYRVDKITFNWDWTQPNKRQKFLDVYMDKEFDLLADKAVYLGSFYIDIVKQEHEGVFSLSNNINQSEHDAKNSYAMFSSRYPKLAMHYQSSMLLATYTPCRLRKYKNISLEENFADSSKGWNIAREYNAGGQYYDMYFENGKYIVETKNDAFSESKIPAKLPYTVPLGTGDQGFDFDIELASAWQSGREDTGFGVIIATGIQSYFFVVSKNGKAAVYRNYSLALPWTEIKVLKDAKEYRQTVEVSPGEARYFVNGEYIGRIELIDSQRKDYIGVVVNGKQKVAFKHLAIKKE